MTLTDFSLMKNLLLSSPQPSGVVIPPFVRKPIEVSNPSYRLLGLVESSLPLFAPTNSRVDASSFGSQGRRSCRTSFRLLARWRCCGDVLAASKKWGLTLVGRLKEDSSSSIPVSNHFGIIVPITAIDNPICSNHSPLIVWWHSFVVLLSSSSVFVLLIFVLLDWCSFIFLFFCWGPCCFWFGYFGSTVYLLEVFVESLFAVGTWIICSLKVDWQFVQVLLLGWPFGELILVMLDAIVSSVGWYRRLGVLMFGWWTWICCLLTFEGGSV
ncbi:hypothetical protein M5K25_027672 [Dendrobium thyrsiflorum]|uniref:Transmembrane protein n=1 Tax=Dendrobium thyrsiflorum TaxID=117978 RepID=A0ABD0TUJ9_DENTH